ncbi:thioredoxin domain-containing protein [Leptolyngbya sp. FACHB-261]|uniref:thioredoxin domain-containing protein n=1 Tax=Leptolyngbya sp. FACHB-261 TaxID=2692806 RepID=UPI001685FDBF|nr:thioredoxin domain-containing protein [Leptolyngbya sp. FACHB-261]MBD2099503.1 thioredoxin domain-containing protein [Leptolyngbya sp. FACHB-261]
MPNRLAQSPSLYLRKHAFNPIDWWPWSPEALAKAQAEDLPIFLSIGYSSCHWCTVMEGEAFSDREIATYMNSYFLPIKVDREERPDLDSIYMQALQLMVGQGGWPLNIFLTPGDLVPFYGGTYFPVEARYGRPGFLKVLQALRDYYDHKKDEIQEHKDQILYYLHSAANLPAAQSLSDDLLLDGLAASAKSITRSGPGPNFPMIPHAALVLQGSRLRPAADDQQRAIDRGLDLALGGIYDHVGGGFHRYTVDNTWTVPHFEKMLYDNGQIVEYLANLWALGVEELAFKTAIEGTARWLRREMTAPEGYFYAAQDADSFQSPQAAEPEEGDFYVWSYGELAELLTHEELSALQEAFTVTPNGNFEGKTVLQRQTSNPLSEPTDAALSKLFQRRYGEHANPESPFPPARNNDEAKGKPWPGRIPPVTDTKMIVAWNSLMISGLARAYQVLAEPVYWQMASRAADFILDKQWLAGRFYRVNYEGTAAVPAQSEDYALFIKALLDLHQAAILQDKAQSKGQTDWLDQAIRVQKEFDDFLWDAAGGGYFNTSANASSDLLIRERSYTDNATPSANGIAVNNLVRLALVSEDLNYLERAEQTLKAFGEVMAKSPLACPVLFMGLDALHNHTLVRTSTAQLPPLLSKFYPVTVYKAESMPSPEVVGLVCQGLACREPARSPEQLVQQISDSQVRQS